MGILAATVVLALIGILIGIALVFTGKKFYVEVDERETAVRECLPGNNCGACGYAGCDAMAAAIVNGQAPVNGCPVGGAPVTAQIGAIMGVSAEAAEKKVAFVHCSGSCEVTKTRGNFVGIQDCRSAANAGIDIWDCDYGCMGFGSCAAVCPEGAIKVVDGVAVVNREKCIGCGLCVKACPKHLVELVPYSKHIHVQCSNKDKGPYVKKVCSVGWIGCGTCQRKCQYGAITVNNNLASIDYSKCEQCGECAEKCPVHIITTLVDRPQEETA